VKAAPREVPSRIRLVLTGHGSGSWVEVRRDSPSGAVLFSGDVGDGDRKAFSGRRLWIRLGAAANVTVSRDGAIVPLTGTVEKLFTAAPS
jgi:hypothetical protein